MDLTRLQYFAAVAEAGSFSRAAAALHLTQSSLSRQVQLLEAEVGQRLLERHGRGAVPTEAGTALLGHARAILELAQRARTDMAERQRNPRGRLTIGLPPRVAHVVTADLVERFHALYPEAGITIMEGLSLRLREWLVGGRADMAILFDPAPSPQIALETLVREPLVLVSSRPLPPRLRLAEVVQRPLVMPSAPNALRRLLDEHAAPRGLSLQLVAEVDSVQTVLNLVARGVADAVLPASAPRLAPGLAPLHVAAIHAPVVRNKLVLAVPTARPATRLLQAGTQLLRELVQRQFGKPPGAP
ncbi:MULTISPECIES: LysR family transcriptional regulator [Ramlibacter]|uniref:LysR family transcriptional regulator n=1 Tax=Ramlibacter pinisoli TaxID=2682844 RepID=A0A6N8ITJ7_9BURK|nr:MULTISPECIES: LysR substrate-binding domain-containing protein [Ramlibacter]MBA2964390.1 LysR family transcriptional regulator [Ramlibacter sp. CGMCC 1.13660]MVQ29356.1 LysR family transcriptional regulator [Ramlibacter pinisoli]